MLALDLWEAAEIAITPEEIEGVIGEPALPAGGKFCLEFRKVGASLMDDHLEGSRESIYVLCLSLYKLAALRPNITPVSTSAGLPSFR